MTRPADPNRWLPRHAEAVEFDQTRCDFAGVRSVLVTAVDTHTRRVLSFRISAPPDPSRLA